MNSRKIIGTVICVILTLAVSGAFAVDRGDPAAFRLISNETDDAAPYSAGTADSSGMAVAESGGGGSCNLGGCDNGCGQSCYCPRWTASADFIILDRIGTKSETLLRNLRTGDELLNSNDFHQGFYGGPRVGLIRHGDCCYDIELLYFQIDGWSSSRFVPANPNGLDCSIGGYTLISTSEAMQFDYASRLYNAELNVRWNPTCRITMLAGFRWVELRENLDESYVPSTLETFWNTTTKNNLYGFQIGTDTQLWECGCLSIGGIAKAGIFSNHAEQRSALRYDTYDGFGTSSTNHTAFLGEVGLQCKYQVTCNLTLRAGYEAIWLDGVALAPGQLQQTDLYNNQVGIDAKGSVFYHGATAGFEYSF